MNCRRKYSRSCKEMEKERSLSDSVKLNAIITDYLFIWNEVRIRIKKINKAGSNQTLMAAPPLL
jgi:hypothetical protein